MSDQNKIVCAKNISFPRDAMGPGPNDNVIVIGGSGRGKTSSVLDANLMYGGSGSMVISDPKGALFDRYHALFRQMGYEVLRLDFLDPAHSIGYNPFRFLTKDSEIQTLANAITYEDGGFLGDPFWDESSQSLCQALIGVMLLYDPVSRWSFERLIDLLSMCGVFTSDSPFRKSSRDFVQLLEKKSPVRFPFLQRNILRRMRLYDSTPDKTKGTIQVTLYNKLCTFDVREIQMLTAADKPTVDFQALEGHPAVLFVTVSDMDRSNDVLASLFFTQCFQELTRIADKNQSHQLNRSVRIFLDDFASSVRIPRFSAYTSTIRSRRISAMVFLQSIAQLSSVYGEDGSEIILDNSDTLVYLGGNDVTTADWISSRTDLARPDVLTLPYGQCLVVRTGEKVRRSENFRPYENYRSRVLHKVVSKPAQIHATIEPREHVIGF